MNAINVIYPYRTIGMWVFDDEARGLVQEPFVGGADTIIDLLTADIATAETGFRLTFSKDAFPGYQWSLSWIRPEMSGNVYLLEGLNREGWLCPALLKYFETPPPKLYIAISELGDHTLS